MTTREEMLEQLRTRTCRVIFKKVDGEERDMRCTLQEAMLPEIYQGGIEQSKAVQPNDAVIRAWDVNKAAFRSFRVENVISFS